MLRLYKAQQSINLWSLTLVASISVIVPPNRIGMKLFLASCCEAIYPYGNCVIWHRDHNNSLKME